MTFTKKCFAVVLALICLVLSVLRMSFSTLQSLDLPRSKSPVSLSYRPESFLAADSITDKLKRMGVVEYHVFRNPHIHNRSNILPVTVVVEHREVFFGCHSFERFFHPTWQTIVVLEQDFADQFGLRKMAQRAVNEQGSPTVHLALFNSTTMVGEWLAREAALVILDHESPRNDPPLFLACNCDTQPLPKWHKLHRPFHQIVARMVHEFLEEDRLNQMQETNINDWGSPDEASIAPLDPGVYETIIQDKTRPLLLLNTAIVETLPMSESLNASLFHGIHMGFQKPWKEQYSKPSHISLHKPWMSDVSTWVEDHLVIYNKTKLAMIFKDVALVSTCASNVRAVPIVAFRYGWKAVRLNEEVVFLDLAKPEQSFMQNDTTISLFDPFNYGNASIDWLFRKSLLFLATPL